MHPYEFIILKGLHLLFASKKVPMNTSVQFH